MRAPARSTAFPPGGPRRGAHNTKDPNMTTPAERLVSHLVRFIVCDADPERPVAAEVIRRDLNRFADAYSLDIQDTATLFRMAAGGTTVDKHNRSVDVPSSYVTVGGTRVNVTAPNLVMVRRGDRLTDADRARAVELLRKLPDPRDSIAQLEQAGYTIVPPVKP